MGRSQISKKPDLPPITHSAACVSTDNHYFEKDKSFLNKWQQNAKRIF